jgi:5'(3')-deoxyribonucleotidase
MDYHPAHRGWNHYRNQKIPTKSKTMKPYILVQDDHLLVPGRQVIWKSFYGDEKPGVITKELFGKNFKISLSDKSSVEVSMGHISRIGGFDWSLFRLGIDLGNTIVRNQTGSGSKDPYPDAFETILKLTKLFGLVCIVSRVNAEQEVRARAWMKDYNFAERTGIKPEDVHFCLERYDKGIIAKKLRLTHFIDDRPEVMHHLDSDIRKILFAPKPEDVQKFNHNHLEQVNSWKEVEQKFLCQET